MDNGPYLGERAVLQGFAFPVIQIKTVTFLQGFAFPVIQGINSSLPHAFSTDTDTK